MQKQKINLANIKGKLSRAEMKNIMAGGKQQLDCGLQNCGGCYDNCKCNGANSPCVNK